MREWDCFGIAQNVISKEVLNPNLSGNPLQTDLPTDIWQREIWVTGWSRSPDVWHSPYRGDSITANRFWLESGQTVLSRQEEEFSEVAALLRNGGSIRDCDGSRDSSVPLYIVPSFRKWRVSATGIHLLWLSWRPSPLCSRISFESLPKDITSRVFHTGGKIGTEYLLKYSLMNSSFDRLTSVPIFVKQSKKISCLVKYDESIYQCDPIIDRRNLYHFWTERNLNCLNRIENQRAQLLVKIIHADSIFDFAARLESVVHVIRLHWLEIISQAEVTDIC